ncbi:MAG: NAD-dependent epimerase/dehydratase family protein [Calditrichaeota bacterium]|nr:NAD-dependent epimerase/dehydratase family protein [Calditrichota bacterium]MCB9391169.1 NAD-dependent epimerase/dehydratase family protein [Calditrichota bacterium]
MPVTVVTGATGFVGSHVAELALAKGSTVRLLVRDTRRLKWLAQERFELFVGDLLDREVLRHTVQGADSVIHCAGLTKAVCEADYQRLNGEATGILAKECESAGVRRFVYCSSLAACGPSPFGAPLIETMSPKPITSYGRSKLSGEAATSSELKQTEWVIVRPPAVMGPRDEQFVPLFKMMRRWGLYTQAGARRREYSLIGVKDLSRILVDVAESHSGNKETYFATMPVPFQWSEVARAYSAATGGRCRRVVIPETLSRFVGALGDLQMKVTGKPVLLGNEKVLEILSESWGCSGEKLFRHLGLKCDQSLQSLLHETNDFYLTQGWI